jgi:hypothetical protein
MKWYCQGILDGFSKVYGRYINNKNMFSWSINGILKGYWKKVYSWYIK